MRKPIVHCLLGATAVAVGCASEGPEAIHAELGALGAKMDAAVAKVDRALRRSDFASRELGEGVQLIESTARALGLIELDERASDQQRLWALLLQARGWDDTARAFARGGREGPALDPAQQDLLQAVLREKAFPAEVAARSAYERAYRMACRIDLADQPMLLELADGLERYSGVPAEPARPCDAP